MREVEGGKRGSTARKRDRNDDDYYRVNERAVIGCGKPGTRLTSYRSFAARSPVRPWPLIVALNITEQGGCMWVHVHSRASTRVCVSRGNCRKIRWFSDTSGRSGTRVSRRLLTEPDPRLRNPLYLMERRPIRFDRSPLLGRHANSDYFPPLRFFLATSSKFFPSLFSCFVKKK